MTHNITSDELAELKDLIRIFTNAKWEGVLSKEQEEEAMRLAEKIDRWINR